MNNQIQLVLKSSTTELSLNDRELGIYLTPELDGLTGLPEIRTTSGVNAGYDGGWTSAQNYDARSITIRGVIANEDVATVEQLRRQLTTLAGQGKNEELTLDLVTQAGKAYTIQVRTIALEMSLQKMLTQQEFMLQLRADDPLIYDASETGHEALLQVAQATGGFTIDFELPLAITGSSEETVVNNEGLEQVPTITRMYGALHNPKIINQTTNQFMQIEADLGFAEGDWIEPSEVVSGKDITINGAPEGAPLSSVQIDGNTSQQTYTGKNLVYTSGKTDGGITATYNSATGETTISGTAVRTYAVFGAVADVLPAGTYTFSIQSAVPCAVGVATKASGGTRAGHPISAGATKTTFTISEDSEQYDIYLTGLTVNTAYSFTFKAMLESGSSATSFEPYTNGPAPNPDYPQAVQTVTGENVVKITGKNLYEWSDTEWSNPATTASWCFQYGSSTAGGGAYGANITDRTPYKITLPAGTYKATVYDISSNIVNIQACKNGTSAEVIITSPTNMNSSNPTSTITLTEQTTLCFRYRVTDPSLGIGDTKIQVERDSATAYEPYQEQSYPISLGSIELCKIGAYQDYIYKNGGKWYVHKEVDRKVLDGSEDWALAERSGSNNGVFYIDYSKIGTVGAKNNGAFSNYARFISGYSYLVGQFDTHYSQWRFYAPNNTITLNEWKTNLGATPLVLYYLPATPTDTEITNEALIEQLEALAAATMYNPQTNITTLYAEGNEQPTLDVSYFTDKNPDTRDELIIDSRLRTITLNGLDVYHLQAPGSEFLMLAPGENRLALQSDITGDNGYAQVSYKQGYLSI